MAAPNFYRHPMGRAALLGVSIACVQHAPANAACTPAGVGAVTAICTGTTTDQGTGAPGTSTPGSDGYGSFGMSGGSVTVERDATVTGSGNSFGVVFATGTLNNAGTIIGYGGLWIVEASIVNYGTIIGTSRNAIEQVVPGAPVSLVNHAGATISSGTIAMMAPSSTVNVINAGTISATNGGVIGGNGSMVVNTQSGHISAAAGVIFNGNGSLINYGSIAGGSFGAVYAGGNSYIFNAGTISATNFAIAMNGGDNTLTLAPGSVIIGRVDAGGSDRLQLGGTGTATFDVSQLGDAAQYRRFGNFDKIDSSTWTLTGTSTYANAVNVNGGTLAVNGNLAAASLLTVNPDGTLSGTGMLGATFINGGTLAPGNSIGTLTMSSLTMTSASTYLVQVSGASSDRTVVTGAATIAGKVNVDPLTRLASTTTYTILNAGTLSGAFDSVSITGNLARNARLSYVGDDVLLTLDDGLLSPNLPGTATTNQKSVATGIDRTLAGSATTPAALNALYALSGNDLLNALTQISGETATGAQQTTFDAMTQFMGVISDPFAAGRGGTAPIASSFSVEGDAFAYAPDGRKRTRTERDAYALFAKVPPRAYEARWNVWAAGFGGSRTTDGSVGTGSARTTSGIGGGAVGADYWFSPETVAGFALAGGGTSFSLAGGGSGRSDLFQAGAFVRHSIASSYVTATAAYGWQDISTDRFVTAAGADRLRADFNANAFSGRIEGGHRWLLPQLGGIGVTPYAALQITAFDLPAYAEKSLTGAGGFALNYAAKTVTATRTELGLRSDKAYSVGDALLTLRGRAAWAHDTNADRSVTATFQSLPGSSFVVNGASAPRNAALTSASAEMSFASGLSLAATFDGEFSDSSRSYAGKGLIRYAW